MVMQVRCLARCLMLDKPSQNGSPLMTLPLSQKPWRPPPTPEETDVLMLLPIVPPGQDLGPFPLCHILHLLCPGALCPHPVLLQGEATIFLFKECRPCEFSMEAGR